MEEKENQSQTKIDPEKIDVGKVKSAAEQLVFDSLAMDENVKDVVIWDVVFKDTKSYGEMAIVTSLDRNTETKEYIKYHTFSEVLVDQFKQLELPSLVTVRKVKGESGRPYFTMGSK